MQGWYFSGTVLGDLILIQRWYLSGTCPWGFHTHARMVSFRSLSFGISYPCNDGTSQVPVLGDFIPYKDGTFQVPVFGDFLPMQRWHFPGTCPWGIHTQAGWYFLCTCPWGFHTHARMAPSRYLSVGISYPCEDGTFQVPVLGDFIAMQGWYFSGTCPWGLQPIQRWYFPGTYPWGFHTHARMVPFRCLFLGSSYSYPCKDGTFQVPVLGDSYPCKDGTYQVPVLGDFILDSHFSRSRHRPCASWALTVA